MSSSTTIRTRWISATLSIPSFCRNTLSICSLSYSCSLAARCQALLSIFLCYVSKCLIKVLIFNTKNMILFYFDKILNQRKIAYHVWRYSKRPRGMTKVFLRFFISSTNCSGGALRSNDNHESRLTQLCNVRRMVQDGLLLPVVFLLPVLNDLRPDHLLTQPTARTTTVTYR